MNRKKITKIIITGFIALLACAIVLPMVVDAGKQVERPFKLKSAGVLSFVTGESFDIGTSTHGGKFTNEAQWILDPNNPDVLYGQGTATFANGDQRYWTAVSSLETSSGRVTSNGGTGIYEDSTGWFDFVMTMVPSEDGTYATYSYTGEGRITY